MKTWIWICGTLAVAASGTALAAGDPLEAKALQQVAAQAPGSVQIAPFFKGSGEKTDWNILLEAGKCYWFSGVAQGKIEDLGLYLWGPKGFFRLSSEHSNTGGVVLAWCTKDAGMHKFQAKIEGEGSYVVGVFGKEAPPAPPPPPPKAELDLGPLCDKAAAGSAPGATRVGDHFKGEGNSVGHDDRFDYTVMMEAGKCYWAIACSEPDHIKSLALYLWGPNGKRITDNKGDNPNPQIGHCSKETGMYKLQAKVTGGGGKFKLGIYAK